MHTILSSRWPSGIIVCAIALIALGTNRRDDGVIGADGTKVSLAELLGAVRQGEARRLGAIVNKSGLIEARDVEGNTPLILAALYAGSDCVETLLKDKADVNAVNKHGVTSLIRAATDFAKAKLLVDAGAKVEVQTKLGNTPLILAARRPGNAATVKLLLERGANIKTRNQLGVSALLAAAAAGDLESVRLLVAAGADVNEQPTPKNPRDLIFAGLRTPLMWAAYNNDVAMMRFLLEHEAKVNQGTMFGTPLTQAAWHDNLEAGRFLLEHAARVDIRDFANFTPLHWAASTESPRSNLVAALLRAGADANAEGGQTIDAFLSVPQTPLMLALKRGRTAVTLALEGANAKAPPARQSPPAQPVRALPHPVDYAGLRTRLEQAVAALQRSAASSRATFKSHVSRQDCFSCHQQFLPMAAVGQVRSRGISFDQGAAKKLLDTLQTPDELNMQAVFHPEPVHSYGYAAFALAADKVPASAATDGFVHHLATIQAPDGRWYNNLPRPPLQSSDVSATALSVLTLKTYGWPARAAEFNRAIDRAKQWLGSVKAETTEEAAYQLLGLHWAGTPAAKLVPLADQLKQTQRADGGWAQLPKLDSDAYATGQVLYALAVAARLPTNDAVWQRGMRYLVQTQHVDGTWSTVRRAFPFQPTIDSGFPHGRDAWISASATSWATMALAQMLPDNQPVAAHKPLIVSPVSRKAVQESARVDFVKHIKPMLERSCVECHSGKRARGHFRVDNRDAIVKPGSTGAPLVVPGDSDKSLLVSYVSERTEGMEMPPLERRKSFPALTMEERALLRAWVDQGAVWPSGVTLRAAVKTAEGD